MFDVHYYDNVPSTMDIARDTLVHGSVVQAGEQASARGRRGNQWSAPKGNLYQSIVLKPTKPRETWGQLSFVIAVALGKAIEKQTAYHLKWPNDVLINDQKLAGILIETHDDFVIIGVGVNIKSAPDGCAKIHDFNDMTVNDFRDVFLCEIEKYFNQWQADGFASIRDLWMAYAYRLGETIQARLANVIYEGVFEGLNPQGILLLREKDGYLREINSGEILV